MKVEKFAGFILGLVFLKALWNCISPDVVIVDWSYRHFWLAITLILSSIGNKNESK